MEKEKYLDKRYTAKERAKDLVSKMDIFEKASQLKYNAPAIKRLGIPAYNYWNEALHGVARAGTATMFPQAIGLSAMFDDEFLKEIGDIVSTEARAKYNEFTKKEDRDIYKGLTMWSPNINIFRDPRWGRGQETYGEDPYLTSRMGVAYVKGLQGDKEVLKTAACAKHFAVHSGPEALRHEFNAEVNKKDLYETYLPAFEACVKEAKVESVMGAYNRTNGEPCCGSKMLMEDILRNDWKFDGHYVSDCWAIADFHEYHKITKTAPESAALALKYGCDMNCGVTYLHLLQALEDGLVTEEQITKSVERVMETRIKLGMFDDDCEYDNIPFEVVDCKEHNEKSLKAVEKSCVLLKNDGILPLDKTKLKSIAVIGPNADSKAILKGNYSGTASKYTTILDGFHKEFENEKTRIYYAEGSHIIKDRVEGLSMENDRISEAVSVAERADVVFLCVGLDPTIEGEQGDASNTEAAGDKVTLDLPKCQEALVEAVLKVNKPTVVLLSSGSALSVNYIDKHANAVLETWYPGSHGGEGICNILFGRVSPSGKLPITFYKSVEELPEFTDYSMKNRTYRYMENEALYPFGYGLTYSKVEVKEVECKTQINKGEDLEIEVVVKNEGNYEVDEVIQCYIKDEKSKYAVLNPALCAFKRVSLKPNEEKSIKLEVKELAFTAVLEDGTIKIDSDLFTIFVGTSQPDKRSLELTNCKSIKKEITLI